MRFLVTTTQKYMVPPEVQVGLLDGSLAWVSKFKASKKLEQAWGFSGIAGGGGIINVDSLEELNQMMSENPLGAVAEIQIFPLIDIEEALTQAKKTIATMIKK